MVKHGILLAGGTGTRTKPFSNYVSKHLINVAGKPIIEYPLISLKQIGIKDLTIVVGSSFSGQILDYVQDGSNYGMNVNYCYQPKPLGIAEAINLCKRFVAHTPQFCVILGDNVYADPIVWQENKQGAQIVLHKHCDLLRFGVASLYQNTNRICKLEEKPKKLDDIYNQFAITGCYLLDQQFFDFFPMITPSQRGEFEISHILSMYLGIGQLHHTFTTGFWSDVGTHESIAYTNNYFFNQ